MSSSKTTLVATSSKLATPSDLPPIRQYKVSGASSWSRRFKITVPPSDTIIYNLTFTSSIKDFSMILHTGPPKSSNPTVVAAAKVSLYNNTTNLSLGDVSSSKLIKMKLNSAWKHNSYILSFPMQNGSLLEMQWKGTNEVKGFAKKMDRGMHHKLVETQSNRLLARYVHDSWSLDVPGVVEIIALPDGIVDVREWDLFVLVGALAVAEKTLKMVGMAIQAA